MVRAKKVSPLGNLDPVPSGVPSESVRLAAYYLWKSEGDPSGTIGPIGLRRRWIPMIGCLLPVKCA